MKPLNPDDSAEAPATVRTKGDMVNIIVHHEEGMFWSEVVELPGCFASGADLEELTEALIEAIGMCTEGTQPVVDLSTLTIRV